MSIVCKGKFTRKSIINVFFCLLYIPCAFTIRKYSRSQRSRRLTRGCNEMWPKKEDKNNERNSGKCGQPYANRPSFAFPSSVNVFSNCLIIIPVVRCAKSSWKCVSERKYPGVRAERIERKITAISHTKNTSGREYRPKATRVVPVKLSWMFCDYSAVALKYPLPTMPDHWMVAFNACLFHR